MAEVARLISELNNASEGTGNAEKSRALLAKQVADLQVKLEESESGGGRGVKAQIRKHEEHETRPRRRRSPSLRPPNQIQESHTPTRRSRREVRNRWGCTPEGPPES